jgi:WD40 repeat protein
MGVSGKIMLGRFNNMRAGAVNVKSPIGPASPLSPASSGHTESLALKSGAVHVPQAPAGSHGDTVQAIVVSSDGKRAVTGGKDREIKVWNVETGEEVCVLLGHKAEVTALHLSEVGRTMISGDSNGTILVGGCQDRVCNGFFSCSAVQVDACWGFSLFLASVVVR